MSFLKVRMQCGNPLVDIFQPHAFLPIVLLTHISILQEYDEVMLVDLVTWQCQAINDQWYSQKLRYLDKGIHVVNVKSF